MNKIEHYGRVEAGKLIIHHRWGFSEAVKVFEGKRVTITVERLRSKRSSQQNRFFHGPIISIIQQGLLTAGFNEARNKEWVKDLIKYKFLQAEVVSETTGEVMTVIRGTSDLTTTEMNELWLDIDIWAKEFLGVTIPEPGQIDIEY